MIIQVRKNIPQHHIDSLLELVSGIAVDMQDNKYIITPSGIKTLPGQFDDITQHHWVFDSDIQLSDPAFMTKRAVNLGHGFIGGDLRNTVLIFGPCAVESAEQINSSAVLVKSLGHKILRAGSFKPRTSPYSFQGMGLEGLRLLRETGDKYGLKIITEVRDATHVEEVIAYGDIIQIGAKAMYDHGILRRCAKTDKPVLIKRGFGTTLQEFVQAAEFILSGGNENVILCERGIRTFESKTRFTLDLCGVAWLKNNTNLPVVVDPSHAIGYAYGVPDLARACMAMGVDGLLIEVHPNPKEARSDAAQQLDHQSFLQLHESLKTVANAVNRNII
ncbi:MAG: 3-deoxy-7-phosphoheptulonate synthase [Bacteroidales bacterium]|nr:3-deoxy-7-phosphoheptulonate synthase [Bacteroidales bacterium]